VYEVRVDGGGVAAGGPDELLQGRLQLLPHAPVVVVVLQDPVQALQQNNNNNNRQSRIIINSSDRKEIYSKTIMLAFVFTTHPGC